MCLPKGCTGEDVKMAIIPPSMQHMFVSLCDEVGGVEVGRRVWNVQNLIQCGTGQNMRSCTHVPVRRSCIRHEL